jgi:hypothetical protein
MWTTDGCVSTAKLSEEDKKYFQEYIAGIKQGELITLNSGVQYKMSNGLLTFIYVFLLLFGFLVGYIFGALTK